jgi:uncharacterized protein (TIGR02466 family)
VALQASVGSSILPRSTNLKCKIKRVCMKIENVFSNFLAADELEIDNDSIAEYCYKVTEGVEKGKTTYFKGTEPELKELFTEIGSRIDALHDHLEFSPNTEQKIYNAWVNVNHNPYIVAHHVHNDCPGMLVSGVYYVKAGEDASALEFKNPNPVAGFVIFPNMIKEYNSFNSSVIRIKPSTGQLVLFPSWLSHCVVPAETSEDRISIAFNTVLKFKK